MSRGYLLGVDIGTYESKGVIVTLDGQVVSAQVRSHDLSIPRPGWAEHDAETVWWGDFCALSRALLADSGLAPDRVLAVGCSTIAPDMLPVDNEGRALRPAVLYGIDTRAAQEIIELEERLGPETVFQRCANALSAQSVGPKILWLKKHEPEIYERAAKFVTGTSFLVARLTGRYVVDHYTAAAGFVPLYDTVLGGWSDDLCRGIVAPRKLPEVAWTAEIAGHVTRAAGDQTGLRPGTPVIVGTCDASAEAVSAGVVSPGQMMVMYGSTVFLIQVLAHPKTDRRLWSAPYLFPGTYCLLAGMSTTGAITRWFRDQFARDLVTDERAGGENAYAALAREAACVAPGADGLLVLPYFSGERTPINDPRARGALFGLTLAHGRGHLYRAILEGVGHGIRHHFDILDRLDADPRAVVAVGGGTKNPLWLEIVSDICGRPQLVPEVTIGAAYGDAFLAGLGVAEFSSYGEISRWVRNARTVTPHPELKAGYDEYHRLYLELYERTKENMHTLAALV